MTAILYRSLSRRAFLLSSGAAAVAVAFGGLPRLAAADEPAQLWPNAWMRVGTDGIVTIHSPAAEMGQGVMTAMPLVLAEEMDLDWSKVRVEQAASEPSAYGNPLFGGAMVTGASRTTRGYFDLMRLAGAQARAILLDAAAGRWQVPASEVSSEPHHAVHPPSGRRLGYGEIAGFAVLPQKPPVVTRAQLKPAGAFRLVGKDMPRVDLPAKVSGRAVFGIDARSIGMLYAAVLRAPVQGEKPEHVEDAAAKRMRGVAAVVALPYGVGVVADTYWAARQARDALKVRWTRSARARAYDSDKALAQYLARARDLKDAGVRFEGAGDVEAALAGAAKRVTAEYAVEHVAHACMEPMNCTARVKNGDVELWAPTQSPSVAQAVAAGAGFDPKRVKVNVTLLGGGFGRRVEGDFVLDAILLAKAVPGRVVKVVWSREDDLAHDKVRPAVAQHLSAGVDAQGRLVALRHRLVGESILGRFAPALLEKSGGRDGAVNEGAFHLTYGVPAHALHYLREERGIDVGFWRGVGVGYTKFALETLVDELAAGAKRDPIAYRTELLAAVPRGRAVLEEVARMADWTRPRKGRALGVAYSDAWDAFIAEVAEVSIDRKRGRIRVHEVWCAVDCGLALQPRNVAAQIESGVMMGVSHALLEKLTFKDGEAQQSNFHDYPVLRMDEAPLVHVKVLPSEAAPGGVGEVGLPPVAPAIANAVARLTGERLRRLPLEPGKRG